MHIAVSGNIGSGKTTLTKMLARHYDWKAEFESVENNPYLKDFYEDMERWSFHIEVFFLNHRFQQLCRIQNSGTPVIQDRTLYEGTQIFAKNLYETGKISERDFENYMDLFRNMTQIVRSPDLLIYLKADMPKLLRQIQMRGRDFESNIPVDYLQNLNVRYNQWIEEYEMGRLLIIDVNELDYANDPEDFKYITELVDMQLNELNDRPKKGLLRV